MNNDKPLRVHGLDLSYFTGKLEAYLRVKGIPYELIEMDSRDFKHCAEITGIAQMPQLEFSDGSWMTDSTQIIAHFEQGPLENPIYPKDPALCFIADLLEDFGDEWLWRPAMYYRWANALDAQLLSDRLARGLLRDIALPVAMRRWIIRHRQQSLFLKYDGVTKKTAPVIEQIYLDTLSAMQTTLEHQPFLIGGRPTQADIGFFGSMFRHFASDPSAARIMRAQAPAVLEWVSRLWNSQPEKFKDIAMTDTISPSLAPLLAMVCDDYLPYLNDNDLAFRLKEKRVKWNCRGIEFITPVSPYRAWCLQQLREKYQSLDQESGLIVDTHLVKCSSQRGNSSMEILKGRIGDSITNPALRTVHEVEATKKPVNSHWQPN